MFYELAKASDEPKSSIYMDIYQTTEAKSKGVKKEGRPFVFQDLLNLGKSKLDLQHFETSEIKHDMESGFLEPGEQIWIFRNSETNPCNPVARYNNYAHVVIYIGDASIH